MRIACRMESEAFYKTPEAVNYPQIPHPFEKKQAAHTKTLIKLHDLSLDPGLGFRV